MKVAISAYGQDLDSEINPRFGRCDFLLIVDTDTMAYDSFPNESMNLGGGAGIQTASFVISKGIQAVLTGSCGPNAMEVFNSAGVAVYPGQTGTVAQAVNRLKNNELTNSTQATAEEKSGMNSGTAPQRPMQIQTTSPPGWGAAEVWAVAVAEVWAAVAVAAWAAVAVEVWEAVAAWAVAAAEAWAAGVWADSVRIS